ncbi:MAG: SLATT domain-containing protein [Bacillota bacterium]
MEGNRHEKLIKRVKELNSKIYTTRKSHINAEERLIKKNNFFQVITVYYSIILIFASILNIKLSESAITSLFLLSSSVAMSLFSLYINSKNITERHFSFKFNYIKLHELLNELDALEDQLKCIPEHLNEYIKVFENINTRYLNVLSSVENHEYVDYLKFKINDGLSPEEQRILDRHWRKEFLGKSVFFTFPFLAYCVLFYFLG